VLLQKTEEGKGIAVAFSRTNRPDPRAPENGRAALFEAAWKMAKSGHISDAIESLS